MKNTIKYKGTEFYLHITDKEFTLSDNMNTIYSLAYVDIHGFPKNYSEDIKHITEKFKVKEKNKELFITGNIKNLEVSKKRLIDCTNKILEYYNYV